MGKKKLLIASRNVGKLQELSSFLSDLPLKLLSLSDVGISDDVEEDGETYEDNAKKKALFYAKKSGLPTIADDGGLEIEALNNAPGVRSRRWIGEHATEEDLVAHMKKIAAELPDTKRQARFVSVIAFAIPSGQVFTTRGQIDGVIAKEPFSSVSKGLPYRLYFYLPDLQKYYHEKALTKEEMQLVNHRRKSVEAMKPRLKQYLSDSD